jgi:glycosyltransferase involved in cell wall biosynthesis
LRALRPDGSPWPRISIVTPSYNQGDYIEETIRSVLLQGYPNVAYGIVDGGSTDATPRILERYRPFLDFCISERDRGQVDAISKGFRLLPPGLVNWINSDDVLAPDALSTLGNASDAATCVTGHVVNFSAAGMRERVVIGGLSFEAICRNKGDTWHQPGVWLRGDPNQFRALLDPRLHIVFDWLYYLLFFMQPQTVNVTGRDLAFFRVHDMAKTQQRTVAGVHEHLLATRLALDAVSNLSQRRLLQRRLASSERHVWTMERLYPATSVAGACWIFLERMVADIPVCFDRFALGMLKRKLLGRC